MAFTNINECRNKSITTSASYQELANQECSEIIVLGPTDGVYIADGAGVRDPLAANAFLVPAGEFVTFRGLTNSNELSALRGSGNQTMYYRTQFFGSLSQR